MRIEVRNTIGETTTIHWHGMHLPAAMDGGPHQPIADGGVWSAEWTSDQPVATLWYHPHLHKKTAEHVYRGIVGLFLIRDEASDRLPSRYGVDDIPLVIQDENFRANGTLDTTGMQFSGVVITGLLGDTILVNGTYDPYAEVTSELVRFRLLNGSNARVYDIGFVDRREFRLVATDNGLLPRPLALRRIMLSPGERAEIVVAFRPGEEAVLRSFPPALGANFLYEKAAGGNDTFDLIKVVAAPTLEPSPPLPGVLTVAPVLRPAPDSKVVPMRMGDFLLNGKTMDHARIDHVARAGAVEVWDVHNAQAIPHNFHIHGVSFQVLDVDGRPPAPHLTGFKDTVYVPPYTRVRLAVQQQEYSDPKWPYMFHCHILAHEDAGMMGQFLVVSEEDEHLVPFELH